MLCPTVVLPGFDLFAANCFAYAMYQTGGAASGKHGSGFASAVPCFYFSTSGVVLLENVAEAMILGREFPIHPPRSQKVNRAESIDSQDRAPQSQASLPLSVWHLCQQESRHDPKTSMQGLHLY